MSQVAPVPLNDFAQVKCAECGGKQLRVNLQPCPYCFEKLEDICDVCTAHHREIHARDKRIKRLEELNALLAARIDELEAEKRNESNVS